MFENFSFSSPSSNGPLSPPFEDSLPPCALPDNHSNLISPLSSRFTSPIPREASYPFPSSQRASPQPSSSLPIGSLILKLDAQSVKENELPPTPPYSPSEDEGYVTYSPDDLSPTSAAFPSTYLDMLAPPPTSHPTGCITLSRRYQRQFLSRLQCSASHALSLAMLAEECHPSSLPLPPMAGSSSASSSRKASVPSVASGPTRIQKSGTARRRSSISLASLSLEDSPKNKASSRKDSTAANRSPRMRNRALGPVSGAGRR